MTVMASAVAGLLPFMDAAVVKADPIGDFQKAVVIDESKIAGGIPARAEVMRGAHAHARLLEHRARISSDLPRRNRANKVAQPEEEITRTMPKPATRQKPCRRKGLAPGGGGDESPPGDTGKPLTGQSETH